MMLQMVKAGVKRDGGSVDDEDNNNQDIESHKLIKYAHKS